MNNNVITDKVNLSDKEIIKFLNNRGIKGGICDLSYPTSKLRRGRAQGGGLLNVKKYKQTNNWINKDGISKPY